MREIKFRGKSLNTREWVKGYYLVNRGRHYIAPDELINPLAKPIDYEVAPDTIGQYTGLNDIEGNEIYEGDIIRHSISTQQAGVYPIGWDEDTLSWATGWREPISEFGDIGDFSARARIIGNIHDNPELMER